MTHILINEIKKWTLNGLVFVFYLNSTRDHGIEKLSLSLLPNCHHHQQQEPTKNKPKTLFNISFTNHYMFIYYMLLFLCWNGKKRDHSWYWWIGCVFDCCFSTIFPLKLSKWFKSNSVLFASWFPFHRINHRLNAMCIFVPFHKTSEIACEITKLIPRPLDIFSHFTINKQTQHNNKNNNSVCIGGLFKK